MYSSFSSTDSGCNSCASLDDAFGSQVQNVNVHNNQYAQPNVLQNHANNVSPGSVAMPQQNNVAIPNVAKEGFVAASNNQVQVNIPGRMVLMNIGAVVLLALAVNECSKYYINRAIQTSEGQPHYYLGYAAVMVCVVVAVHYLSKKMV